MSFYHFAVEKQGRRRRKSNFKLLILNGVESKVALACQTQKLCKKRQGRRM